MEQIPRFHTPQMGNTFGRKVEQHKKNYQFVPINGVIKLTNECGVVAMLGLQVEEDKL
jgi:hypothetical protein